MMQKNYPMVIMLQPEFLAWYIRKGEQETNEPWWPDFLETFETAPEVIVETIYVNLSKAASTAMAELHIFIEVEYSQEFAKSIFTGLRDHFCRCEK